MDQDYLLRSITAAISAIILYCCNRNDMSFNSKNIKQNFTVFLAGIIILFVALVAAISIIFQQKLQHYRFPAVFFISGVVITVLICLAVWKLSGQYSGFLRQCKAGISPVGQSNAVLLNELTLLGVFDNSPAGIAIVDIDGKFHKTNHAFNSILGYSHNELREKDFRELTHPDDTETCVTYWQNALAGGPSALRSEKRYIHQNGIPVWVALNVVLVKDKHDNPLHFIAQVEDITEKRKIAEQLFEREEQLKVFAEHSPASQVMLDRDMCYLILSNRCKKDYGIPDVPNEELYGKCHYDMFPAFPDHWKDINSRCLAGAVERSDEEPFIGPDGQTHWMTYEVRPWHKANGDIGGIIVFTESITRIKEAELKFRSLVEKSIVGVYIIQKGAFTYVNPRLAQMFGYTEEQMIGMPVEKLIHPDHKRRVSIALIPGKPDEERAVNFEAKGITSQNETIWFEAFGTTTLYNKTAAVIGSLVDVTGRKKADEVLKEKMTQLQTITNNLPNILVYQLIRYENGQREITYVSEGVQRLNGKSSSETIKEQDFLQWGFTEETWEQIMKAEIESSVHLTNMKEQISLRTNTGHELTLEVVAVPRRLNSNTVLWDGVVTDITDIKRTEKELIIKNYQINKRVKELNGLYQVSKITAHHGLSVLDILSSCVQVIPTAYRFPDKACARIRYLNKDFQTENFKETPWGLNVSIYVSEHPVGSIEVFYTEFISPPDDSDDLFLEEEKALMNSIAEMIGGVIERVKADKELKESEQKFRSLVEQSLVGVIILQKEKFVYVNAGFEKICGYSRDELLYRLSLENLADEEYLPVLQQINTEGSQVRDVKPVTLKIICREGEARYIEVISSSIIYQANPAVIATIIDVTDKLMEEQRINRAILETQEEERMQIGMELHDNVNQLLSASNMYLDILKKRLGVQDGTTELIDNVRKFILDANGEIRNLSHQLAPTLDPSYSLSFKIETLVKAINPEKQQLNVVLEIDDGDTKPYNNEVQTAVYRIVQEQLNNILKYSKATSVLLKISREAPNLILSIKDNGIGFDTSIKKDGIGLGNIRRRAMSLGGKAEVISSPGNGCEVVAIFPL